MTHVPPLLTKIPFQINEIPRYRAVSRRYHGNIATVIVTVSRQRIAAVLRRYRTYHSGIVSYHYALHITYGTDRLA